RRRRRRRRRRPSPPPPPSSSSSWSSWTSSSSSSSSSSMASSAPLPCPLSSPPRCDHGPRRGRGGARREVARQEVAARPPPRGAGGLRALRQRRPPLQGLLPCGRLGARGRQGSGAGLRPLLRPRGGGPGG
ncbi:unnamed protein product, partial [Prorocentrum cordatum]